ncbi:peptidase M19 [Limnobacter humi]|uniref:Peptidase M19 n=1 Tax=Limnobacter humi TaxID=1778671 RepID=A0ABT1WHH7_9BURK|nr:peptidase M19 [Limnobacter humi]MCQ8896945.1 peptidase M19 [Limnobacter humi]
MRTQPHQSDRAARCLSALGLLAAVTLLGACNSDSGSLAGGGNNGTPTSPSEVVVKPTAFNIANQCHALQSVASGKFVSVTTGGTYAVDQTLLSKAAPLYLKPSALGKYMLFNANQQLMQGVGNTAGTPVTSTTAYSDSIEWSVLDDERGRDGFSLTNTGTQMKLALLDSSSTLGSVEKAATGSNTLFRFVPTQGCADFPEISTNTTGDTFTGAGENQALRGFADVHNHITATTFLGGAHHGRPFHRFGVTQALDNCQTDHGPDGRLDLVENLFKVQPQATHDTVGWPTFNDWPAADSLTHEGLYYKWLERAWKAGLRIFVTNLVENETLCNLVRNTKGKPTQNCNEMDSAVSQIAFARDLESYVDAQYGGNGKGWFRIVTTPAEARKVVNEGKLAVVLGIEISHLFNCGVKLGQAQCDQAEIDRQLDRLYNLGVRQMFPIHEFDNAFGGNGIFDGLVLNGGNFLDTGAFWTTYDCPGGDNNYKDYILRQPGAVMTSVPGLGNDPLSSAVIANNPGLPVYPSAENRRQCNKRGLTELGKYAFKRLMERGIIIEVDHLELSIKGDLIDLAERQVPAYPLVSTHGAHGGITREQARRMIAAGGLVYPYQGNAQAWTQDFKLISSLKSPKYDFAVGYGADTNGLGAQAGPRGADRPPVKYPFTLFSGKDWDGVFNKSVSPVKFDQQKSGERIYDANAEGQAHYGLKADWVEEVRLEGGNEALKALYNSAEVYIQMWERTQAKRSKINP